MSPVSYLSTTGLSNGFCNFPRPSFPYRTKRNYGIEETTTRSVHLNSARGGTRHPCSPTAPDPTLNLTTSHLWKDDQIVRPGPYRLVGDTLILLTHVGYESELHPLLFLLFLPPLVCPLVVSPPLPYTSTTVSFPRLPVPRP